MQLPEITIANQSFQKVGFINASHVEVFSEVFSMGGVIVWADDRCQLASSQARIERNLLDFAVARE